MRLAAHLLQDLGFLLYAGPLVAFSILVWISPKVGGMHLHGAIRSYRAWGPGLGLSLGACILGSVVGHYLDHSAFNWNWGSPSAQMESLVWGVFLLAWVSNIKLEVWTLEPLRKLDSDAPSPPPDPQAYQRASRKLSRHMCVHSVLLLTVAVLEISRRAT